MLDPRSRLIVSQMRETLREFDKKLAELLGEDRLVHPDEFTVSKQEHENKSKRAIICRLCGYVGGNARGCGKPSGHPTLNKPAIAIVK